MRIRLILADDHPVVVAGLCALFSRESDFRVLACCRTGDAALAAVREQRPDVLVLDLRMPPAGGLEVLQAIGRERLRCRTMVLTASATPLEVASALRLGALGIALKESAPEALFACVREVHSGRRWIDRDIQVDLDGARDVDRAAAPVHPLTRRETEIVRKLARGLRNRDIAADLAISEGTVKIHLHRIYDKLQLNGRLELLLYAQQNGLL